MQELTDTQNERDDRNIDIDRVGGCIGVVGEVVRPVPVVRVGCHGP